MRAFRFIKTGQEWYVDLPEFIEQGGSEGDLQMVEGADLMLDMMAANEQEIVLNISDTPFEGAEILELLEKRDPLVGGGDYLMKYYEGEQVNKKMWLCRVTEFVFGDIPS